MATAIRKKKFTIYGDYEITSLVRLDPKHILVRIEKHNPGYHGNMTKPLFFLLRKTDFFQLTRSYISYFSDIKNLEFYNIQ